MTSSKFAPSSASPDKTDLLLEICGWSGLGLLIALVVGFGAVTHLGLLEPADPLAAEIALHQQLNRLAQELGLSRQADTRTGELEKDPAKLAALHREIAEILARNPRSPRALYYQALERLSARDYPAARAAASRGLEIEPRNLPACLVLGVSYYEEKNYPEAEKAFRRAIEIEPQALSAYDNLGQTLWLMNRHDEALAVYRRRAEIEGLPVFHPATPAAATPAQR